MANHEQLSIIIHKPNLPVKQNAVQIANTPPFVIGLELVSAKPVKDAVTFKAMLLCCLEESIGIFGAAVPCDVLKLKFEMSANYAIVRIFVEDEKTFCAALITSSGTDGENPLRWSIVDSKGFLLALPLTNDMI